MDLHARRADSFGAQAGAYAEHRPDYPVAAIRWALEPLGTSERLDVLDLAAGTGKLTSGLVAEGHRVTAVEPNEQMLSELVRRVHDVRALPGHAEHIPVPDSTVDAVFVGTAFHWFDQEKALPEIARVLRPGGVLAALWVETVPDVEWVSELEQLSASSVESRRGDPTEIMAHPSFGPVERNVFPHTQRRDSPEALIATTNTYSRMIVIDEEERAAINEKMLAFLRQRPETSNGPFDVPLRSEVYRMVRVSE
ncbi:Ubiquinone/menaquinone biosynthesis C-methylase UbiE [Lentzea albidocapillata subsp. violacea]|uniref:Ubiquinone/menaquinone biosynthesis C-methylase UbiE n=1 Tax=Lentzea albidocapillata subsp. violacea TaxID=128104 RepID=A0A1G9HR90_9PSEU|nr:class I SAM-dependent methyltransferase [Lentzea albidocapillata]SDL15355.1 Ubiquinone/menaquinone biosynthesis C-methylase UbiE [Lentzea albidocapillata subsp. violacea]